MKDTTRNDYHERMLTVLLHIQAHLDDPLSLESLAAVAHLSPTHFHRIFKGMMGETVIEHIRRIRLERSAARLIGRQSTVTEAAFDAGYETVESFSRAFRKMFDCPPSRFRHRHREALARRLPGFVHYQPDAPGGAPAIYPQGGIQMDVRIKDVPPQPVIFVRHTGPYELCGPAWTALYEWAAPRGLWKENVKFLGVSYDDPQVTPAGKIRFDACITVDEDIETKGRIGKQTLDGGPYAVYRHKGPYAGIEQAYAQLMGQWLPQSGRELDDTKPSLEHYLNDPDVTAPEERLTDLYLPLK